MHSLILFSQKPLYMKLHTTKPQYKKGRSNEKVIRKEKVPSRYKSKRKEKRLLSLIRSKELTIIMLEKMTFRKYIKNSNYLLNCHKKPKCNPKFKFSIKF